MRLFGRMLSASFYATLRDARRGFRDAGFKAAAAGPRAAAMTTNMWLMALAGAFAVLAQVLAIKYVTGLQ
jgi:hypothetical protein